jgi:hypothetical protein
MTDTTNQQPSESEKFFSDKFRETETYPGINSVVTSQAHIRDYAKIYSAQQTAELVAALEKLHHCYLATEHGCPVDKKLSSEIYQLIAKHRKG